MIDSVQAREIASRYIADPPWDVSGDRLILLDAATLEKPYGWVFFYTSEQWLATGDIRFAIAGNAPFLVKKSNGDIHVFGTALVTEKYIEQYERSAGLAD